MPSLISHRTSLPRQRGSMTVALVFALLVGLVLLGGTQLGYAFYMKREMQKSVDLAAISAAQVLGSGSVADCARARAAGSAAALKNLPNIMETFTAADVMVQCKVWDSTRADSTGMHVFDPVGSQLPNAVQVSISKVLGRIIPSVLPGGAADSPAVTTAVASTTQPVAAFTVGSRLLRLNRGGLLSSVLSAAGATPAQLDVLDAAGLASVNITPSGLLKALGLPLSVATGVGTPAQLAIVNNLTLAQLLRATATVVSNSGVATADVSLLANAITTLLQVGPLNAPVKLFGTGGLFTLSAGGDTNSALAAQVNARNIIETSLAIANGQNLINLGLSVPLLGVQSQVRVVEPPTLAIGGIGVQAVSAGIRVYLRANTSSIPVVGPLLSTLGTKVDLPVIIDVAQSVGTLTNLCQAPLAKDQATIAVTSSLANVCVGKFPAMVSTTDQLAADFVSLTNTCKPATFSSVQRYQVLNVLGILPLNSRVTLSVFNSAVPVSVTLNAPPSANATATVNATTIDLVTLANNLADAVIGGLLGDVLGTGIPLTTAQRDALAADLVGGGGSDAGKSITQVFNDMKWSASAMQQLGTRLTQGGLTGVLGGTLQTVGNLLTSVLIAPLGDTVCLLALTPSGIRQCRVNGVSNMVLSGDSQTNGVAGIVIALLQPLLAPLSTLVQNLLNTLGLSLGQTDVSLLSVDCGTVRLVY